MSAPGKGGSGGSGRGGAAVWTDAGARGDRTPTTSWSGAQKDRTGEGKIGGRESWGERQELGLAPHTCEVGNRHSGGGSEAGSGAEPAGINLGLGARAGG